MDISRASKTLVLLAFTASYPSFAQINPASTPQKGLPVFNVADYGATGSTTIAFCSGQKGSNVIGNCFVDGSDLYAVGQGLHIVNGGPPVQALPVTEAPSVTQTGPRVSGGHMYCYVVAVADALSGITPPSPKTCVSGEPEPLSYTTTYNTLNLTNTNLSAAPTFLWYVSEDGGNYFLLSAAGAGNGAAGQTGSAFALDQGQRANGTAGDNRGFWPDNIPAGSISQIAKPEELYTYITVMNADGAVLADALGTSVQSALVLHDDTRSIQNAINAAVAAGGGTVQLNDGSYLLGRPSFVDNSVYSDGGTYPTYTTATAHQAWGKQYSFLQIPNGSAGHIHLQGNGAKTVITLPSDSGGWSHFIDIGEYGRPAYSPGALAIAEVDKGATQVTLVGSAAASMLKPGDDVWLYSGSYQGACQNAYGTPGGQCHFSELNTVKSYDSGSSTVTLKYPTAKRYYQDSADNSFGMVKLPVTPHDISISNMTFNTYNPILGAGMVFDLLIDSRVVNNPMGHGGFGGGFKRGLTVQNSTWHFGIGDVSFYATDEFDQFTNVSLLNNNIYGYAAPGAEGPSMMAKVSGTEGSSQFTIKNNHFYNASISLDQTSDDVITGNSFNNGFINVGSGYSPLANCYEAGPDAGFTSYGSQATVDVEANVFSIDASFNPAFVLRTGAFDAATITNNQISYAGGRDVAAMSLVGGTVSGNTIAITGASTSSVAFCVAPNQTPAIALSVQGNTVTGNTLGAIAYAPDPGFQDPATITMMGNTIRVASGNRYVAANPSNTPFVTH